MVQSPAQPAMLRTKFPSSAAPFGVCTTSGWNCTPYSRRESSAIAANGAPVEMPTARKPGGSLRHAVAVAHPHLRPLALLEHAVEQRRLVDHLKLGAAELA